MFGLLGDLFGKNKTSEDKNKTVGPEAVSVSAVDGLVMKTEATFPFDGKVVVLGTLQGSVAVGDMVTVGNTGPVEITEIQVNKAATATAAAGTQAGLVFVSADDIPNGSLIKQA
jgi:hypothetical protein